MKFLALYRINENIQILSELIFKKLKQFKLEGNNDDDKLDIYENVQLELLCLEYNKLENIESLSKAPFYDLIT